MIFHTDLLGSHTFVPLTDRLPHFIANYYSHANIHCYNYYNTDMWASLSAQNRMTESRRLKYQNICKSFWHEPYRNWSLCFAINCRDEIAPNIIDRLCVVTMIDDVERTGGPQQWFAGGSGDWSKRSLFRRPPNRTHRFITFGPRDRQSTVIRQNMGTSKPLALLCSLPDYNTAVSVVVRIS